MCSLTPKFIIDAVKEMADGQPGKTITIADLREYAQSCSSLLMDELLQEDPENTCETEWLGISIWRHCNLLERELSDELEAVLFSKKITLQGFQTFRTLLQLAFSGILVVFSL